MYKEIILTIIIFATVIIGDNVTQGYTEYCVDEMNKELDNLRDNIITISNNIEINKIMNSIEASWENKKKKLVLYLEHDELEKVSTQLVDIHGKIDVNLFEEGVSEIDKCKFLLDHIEEKEKFNLKNLF